MKSKDEKVRSYKKRTILGYFVLGVAAFLVGLAYDLYEDVSAYSSLKDVGGILFDNLQAIVFAIISSLIFYYTYFTIRKNIDEISAVKDEKDGKYNLDETELSELRKSYMRIKRVKQQETDEPVKNEDILGSNESNKSKDALVKWMNMRKQIFWVFVVYLLVFIIIIVLMLGISSMKFQFLRFFAPYTVLFVFSTFFYAFLFYTLRLKSFMRLSYSVLYPTILSIAVNMYFGLSAKELCSDSFSLSTYVPIIVFAVFFCATVIIELLSYRGEEGESNEHLSTYGFVLTSILMLGVSILSFSLAANVFNSNSYVDAFSNLLFAIAISLYLGIFEGWDALRSMNINVKSALFAKHYRWWNFLQICYPLAFFFVVGLVQSEIFTFELMLAFTIVSIMSTVIWKRGGEKESYNYTNWGIRKIFFGVLTVVLIFINRLLVMNGIFNLMTTPTRLKTDKINVELIVMLLGALNGMFVFWGVRVDEQKKYVLMALPLTEVKKYEEFSSFCRYGFIYDFSNYIYLVYIFVVHVLLFSTGFFPENPTGSEGVATILIILMIVVYMFFSFKTKFKLYIYDSKSDGAEIKISDNEQ